MRGISNVLLPVLVLAIGLLAPARARAASAITDDGQFFSPEAIARADEIIKKNPGHPHPDIRIITVPSIPEHLKKELETEGKERMFENWADKLGQRDRVNGVVILICKNPGHLQIVQGNETRERVFVDADRRELVSKLLPAFKAKKYDEGLLEAVKFIREREAENVDPTHRPRPPQQVDVPALASQPAPPTTVPATAPTTRPQPDKPAESH